MVRTSKNMRQAHAQSSCVLTYICLHEYEGILCFLLFEQLLSYVWMDKDNSESSSYIMVLCIFFQQPLWTIGCIFEGYYGDGDTTCYGSYPTLKEY